MSNSVRAFTRIQLVRAITILNDAFARLAPKQRKPRAVAPVADPKPARKRGRPCKPPGEPLKLITSMPTERQKIMECMRRFPSSFFTPRGVCNLLAWHYRRSVAVQMQQLHKGGLLNRKSRGLYGLAAEQRSAAATG